MKPVTRISHSLYPSGCSARGVALSATCEQIAAHWRNATQRKACCEHLRSARRNAKQYFVASARQRGCVSPCRHLEQVVCNMLFCVALANSSRFRLQVADENLGGLP